MEAIGTVTPSLSGPPEEGSQKKTYARIGERQWQVTAGHPRQCRGCDDGLREVLVCDNVTHALCRECDQKDEIEQTNWAQPRTCRWCTKEKDSVDPVIREALNRSLAQNADECTFQCVEKNCTWSGQYTDIPRHSGHCIVHTYPCQFQEYGCKEKDTKDNLSNHVINCKFRVKSCQQCQQPYSIAQAEKHAQSCPQRLETSAISLPHSSWQLLEPMGQWPELDPEAQQKALQTTITLMTEAQKISLASAIANRTAISTLCKFGCGAILQHPTQLTEHYQSHCPNGLTSCRHCKLECLRKELGQHYEHCLQVPEPCPWGCAQTITRQRIQDGYHKAYCDKATTKCAYCRQTDTRAAIRLHERTCELIPWSCRYCYHSTHISKRDAHRKTCPETQPFTLAGCQYTLQMVATARVYQRANEAPTSHVCIPITKATLQSWTQGNPAGLEYALGVERQSYFTLRLGQDWQGCYFNKKGALGSKSDHSPIIHLFYVDADGHYLGQVCTGLMAHYAMGCVDTYSVNYDSNSNLDALADKAPVFVIISLLPHASLFPDPPPAKRNKK